MRLTHRTFVGPLLTLVLVSAAAAAGCTGAIGDADDNGNGTPSTGTAAPAIAPAPAPRLARLTHPQWENTVRDLLALPERPGLSARFGVDPVVGGVFGNRADTLSVGQNLWQDYRGATEELAARVARDAAARARIVPADLPDAPELRASAFVRAFLRRAYRRPPTEIEVTEMVALFARGPELTGQTDPFAAGVEIVLQAALQSVTFLYRVETSVEVRDGIVPLDDHEIAARLSFALWDTMPDDALFAAADRGELRTAAGVTAQAERMLRDPRAESNVLTFHRQLLGTDRYETIKRDPAIFPEFTPTLPKSMQREVELLVREVVFTEQKGWTRLLTAPFTFVDRDLAAIYGVAGTFTADFQRVALDPNERSGLLTTSGFLAANSHGVHPDPIHRGVFVNRRILCAELPAPPANVPPVPQKTGGTNRERIESHTGAGTCGAGCHSTLINPVGFAFEKYDAIGKTRSTDNGMPINTTGQYPLDGVTVPFRDAVELSGMIARSTSAHECYAQHWLTYLLAREQSPVDAPLLAQVAERSRAHELSVQQLIVEILRSDTFRARAAQEYAR